MIPPKIVDALDLLASFPPTRPIADFLRSGRVKIIPDNPDPTAYAVYRQHAKAIHVGADTASAPVEAVAAILAHEGRHALDDFNGQLIPSTVQGLTEGEYRGYLEDARFWAYLYGPNGKPNPESSVERQLNDDIRMALDGSLWPAMARMAQMRASGFWSEWFMASIESLLSVALGIIDAQADPEFRAIGAILRRTPMSTVNTDQFYAQFSPDPTPAIQISTSAHTAGMDAQELAANLIHEGKHALDYSRGLMDNLGTWQGHLSAEERATETEAQFWKALYPLNDHPIHNELSEMEKDKGEKLRNGTLKNAVDEIYTGNYLQQIFGRLFG